MQKSLHIACLQVEVAWENPEVNKEHYSLKIDALSSNVDLIILPEMFSTGFSMNPENCAEKMNGESVEWMKKIAIKKSCAIMGSLIIEDQGKYFNRLVFVHPSGAIEVYDKRHLFSFAGEDEVFSQGTEKLIVDYLGWKICPMICYDLRFPVWSRNQENYDLLIYVANWPKPRIQAWDTLLKARAIENLSYVIGVNRVGEDANNLSYIGHTQVLDALGNSMVSSEDESEIVLESKLEMEELGKIRNNFQFLNDKDSFSVKK